MIFPFSLFRKETPAERYRVKDKSDDEGNTVFGRLCFSMFVIICLTCVLFVREYRLQIQEYSTYETKSDNNRIKIVPIAPDRGLIYDRNGVLLAENRQVNALVATPSKSDDIKKAYDEINGMLGLGLDENDKKAFMEQIRQGRAFQQIPVTDKLSEKQMAVFAVNRFRFPEFSVVPKLKRFYPMGDLLTHVVGYVARINTKDQEKIDAEGKTENYAATQDIGKLGVEKYYEDLLHGKSGYRKVEVNNRGREIRVIESHAPTPGNDIYLTIDVNLQKKGYELLKGKRAGLIMIDPNNGEILASVSSPSYDPNLFVRGITRKEYSELLNNPDRPLINRVSVGNYSPASTIKPLMAFMGLNEKMVTTGTRFFGAPYFTLPGSTHKFRDWRKWGHGWMDIYRAIEISADTFFYDLAYRSGIDRINRYMSMFGFGQPSGIDVMEESMANLPSRDWKRARHHRDWYPGDTVSIGIGQGYWTTTLLQLVRAHSILTQHGHNVVPHFMLASASREGREQNVTDRSLIIKANSELNWKVPLQGMYLVVNGPEGTGRRAFAGARYVAAGKSGTAQIIGIKQDQKYNANAIRKEHRDNALFVAFAPFDQPKVVAGIILENLGGGSRFAAPLVRRMLDAYLDPATEKAREEKLRKEAGEGTDENGEEH